jgi:hypothetical protein
LPSAAVSFANSIASGSLYKPSHRLALGPRASARPGLTGQAPSDIVPDVRCRYLAAVEALPDQKGTAWQNAIDYGIDVSLLEENLRLTPDERLEQLVAMQRLFDSIRAERPETSRGTR